MAGQPLRRERIKQAEAGAEEARAELNAMRLALIRAGLKPEDYGASALVEPMHLTAYSDLLPRQVQRLAAEGKSIEESRVLLGFTEAQEQEWASSYVDFREALARTRAREEAFWQGQARQLAAAGDRPGFVAVSALIERRFHGDNSKADASNLVVVHAGARLDKPVAKDD